MMNTKIIDQRINRNGPFILREIELTTDKNGNIIEVSHIGDDIHYDIKDTDKTFAGGPAATTFQTEFIAQDSNYYNLLNMVNDLKMAVVFEKAHQELMKLKLAMQLTIGFIERKYRIKRTENG